MADAIDPNSVDNLVVRWSSISRLNAAAKTGSEQIRYNHGNQCAMVEILLDLIVC